MAPGNRQTAESLFYLGSDPKNPRRLFWLGLGERRAHMAVFGASGSGKSQLLLDLCMQDVMAGRGFALIDPKGDLVRDVVACLSALPEERWNELARDLVIIDPSDPSSTTCFNPLELGRGVSASRQRQDLVSVFRKVWKLDDAQTPRLGLVLRRALQLAVENDLTLCDMQRILTDNEFRDGLVARTEDASLRLFWEREFPRNASAQLQWTASSLVRLESFLDDPQLRRFFGQQRSSFDFREIMDSGRICLINLGKGALGEETSHLLGGFLLGRMQLAAESRQEMLIEARRPFYLFVDEFQNYATRSFEEMLAEARGYGLSLVMANQHLAQLDDSLRQAVLSNARIRVAFRLSYDDAAMLAPELFRVTGERKKETRWETVRLTRNLVLPVPEPVYYAAGEEMRQNREALHYLPDRLFWCHLAGPSKPRLLRSVDIPRAHLAAATERAARLKALVYSRHQLAPLETKQLPEPRAAQPTYDWKGGLPALTAGRAQGE